MFETLTIIATTIYSQFTVCITDYITGSALNFLPESSDTTLQCLIDITLFHIFQSCLYSGLPHRKMFGTKTKQGNIPEYNDNGLLAWVITVALQVTWMNELTLEELRENFDLLPNYQKSLNIYGLLIALKHYFTALYYKNQVGVLNEPYFSGNPVKDFYKGVELHPRNSTGDIKLVINSRVGMTLWGNIVLFSMIANNSATSTVFISGMIQLIYITKFFIWESGYVRTTDITLDRCGYMLFWGCICYVPTVYTSPSVYHYYNPIEVSTFTRDISILLGTVFIFLNWDVDTQRTRIRDMMKRGKGVFGPPEVIEATYKTEDGEENKTWLVATGWWGMASNINYLFEILSALMWTTAGTLPRDTVCYLYVVFLTILLVHRTFRIEKKCREKYGEAWKKYRYFVPYKILPSIF